MVSRDTGANRMKRRRILACDGSHMGNVSIRQLQFASSREPDSAGHSVLREEAQLSAEWLATVSSRLPPQATVSAPFPSPPDQTERDPVFQQMFNDNNNVLYLLFHFPASSGLSQLPQCITHPPGQVYV